MDRLHRIIQVQVLPLHGRADLDGSQNQRSASKPQEGGNIKQVRISPNHVDSPPVVVVGVGFVAGVEDRTVERSLQPDVILDVVGTLGNLEPRTLRMLADPHPSAPAEDLPRG